MKILLIAPASEALRVDAGKKAAGARVFRFSQLSLLTVAACTPEGHEVRLVDEQVEPIDFTAEADLVGITFMTAHAPRAYEMAAQFRRRGCEVVAGGYHPTLMTDEVLEHFDAVVVGEAENTWPDLVRDAQAGCLHRVYRADERPDMAAIRRPPRHMLARGRYATVNAVQAGRGCPHGCRFCSVSRFFDRAHRLRPVDEVIAEVASLDSRFFLFVDDNIIGDPAYARELFTRMAGLKKKWVSQCSITIADDAELTRLAAAAGCVGLFVGLETVNNASLAEADKGFNRIADYRTAVKQLHDVGIGVESGIVFGFDSDDASVFERTLDAAERIGLDAVQASILTPLPGTALFDEMDRAGRILTRDWRQYDFRHAVFRPARMSAAELQNGADWFIEQYYKPSRIAQRLWRCGWSLGWREAAFRVAPVNYGYWTRVKQWGIHGEHPRAFDMRAEPWGCVATV